MTDKDIAINLPYKLYRLARRYRTLKGFEKEIYGLYKGEYYCVQIPSKDCLYYLATFEDRLIIDERELEVILELINTSNIENALIASHMLRQFKLKE